MGRTAIAKAPSKARSPKPPSLNREIQLLDDAVLIRVDHIERMSASKLLFLPPSAKRQPHELYRGTVIRVGPGQLRKTDGVRIPCECKIGDQVLFYWAAAEIEYSRFFASDDELRIISEKSIQAVLS